MVFLPKDLRMFAQLFLKLIRERMLKNKSGRGRAGQLCFARPSYLGFY